MYNFMKTILSGIKSYIDKITGNFNEKVNEINDKIPTKNSQLENDAGFLTNETDPTVPDWAKQETKPSYTVDEIEGAVSEENLPTKLSDLENDLLVVDSDLNTESINPLQNKTITKAIQDVTVYYDPPYTLETTINDDKKTITHKCLVNLDDLVHQRKYKVYKSNLQTIDGYTTTVGVFAYIDCNDGSRKQTLIGLGDIAFYINKMYDLDTKKQWYLYTNVDNINYYVYIDSTDRTSISTIVMTPKHNVTYLGVGNNIEYIPTTDYSPATKKYVDDSIATNNSAIESIQTALDNYYLKSEADALHTEILEHVDTEIANLVGTAPETLDTIEELATAFEENAEVVEVLNQAIANKADVEHVHSYNDLTDRTHGDFEEFQKSNLQNNFTINFSEATSTATPRFTTYMASLFLQAGYYAFVIDGKEYISYVDWIDYNGSNYMGAYVETDETTLFICNYGEEMLIEEVGNNVMSERNVSFKSYQVTKNSYTKQLDDKYIPDNISREGHGHSWDELNEKPFYGQPTKYIIEEMTLESDIDYDSADGIFLNPFEEWTSYIMVLDGEEYIFTVKSAIIPDTGGVWGHYYNCDDFSIQYNDYLTPNCSIKINKGAYPHTIEVYEYSEGFKQIEEYYIPDTIARIEDVDNKIANIDACISFPVTFTYNGEDDSYTSDKTFEEILQAYHDGKEVIAFCPHWTLCRFPLYMLDEEFGMAMFIHTGGIPFYEDGGLVYGAVCIQMTSDNIVNVLTSTTEVGNTKNLQTENKYIVGAINEVNTALNSFEEATDADIDSLFNI